MGKVHVGVSGWRYPPWRGTFYPEGLQQRLELSYIGRCFDTVEINGSFYSLQRPESYARWYRETPPGFIFAVKGSRYITHMKRLRDVDAPLANFFASGVLALGEKLGPFLWQLPPQLPFHPDELDRFLARLPRSTREAAALARDHDARLDGRAFTRVGEDRPLRHALEVRHPSFASAELVALLRAHRVALCVADTAGKFPYFEDVTSDFVYVRLHGDKQIYVSGYDDESLDGWARRVRAWQRGADPRGGVRAGERRGRDDRQPRDVYVYFDNDVKVRAPFDAMGLGRRLGVSLPPGASG